MCFLIHTADFVKGRITGHGNLSHVIQKSKLIGREIGSIVVYQAAVEVIRGDELELIERQSIAEQKGRSCA